MLTEVAGETCWHGDLPAGLAIGEFHGQAVGDAEADHGGGTSGHAAGHFVVVQAIAPAVVLEGGLGEFGGFAALVEFGGRAETAIRESGREHGVGVLTAVAAGQCHHAHHLRVVDERLVEVGFAGDRQLQHDLLVSRERLELGQDAVDVGETGETLLARETAALRVNGGYVVEATRWLDAGPHAQTAWAFGGFVVRAAIEPLDLDFFRLDLGQGGSQHRSQWSLDQRGHQIL